MRCERWGGWWFVNLDPDAMPLLEWLDPLPTPARRRRPLADCANSTKKSVELGCNWKILAEGFLEVYHARTIHPQTVAPTLDTRGTVISLFDHGHQNMISPVKAGTRTDNRDALGTIDHVPPVVRPNCSNRPTGSSRTSSRRWTGAGFPFLVFWPTGDRPDTARHHLVRRRLGRGRDCPAATSGSKRLDRFDVLMDEDYQNLEPIQRSMEFAAHGGQVVNYQERRIWHVHAWIDKVIGPELIPEELRVPDLLADFVEQI